MPESSYYVGYMITEDEDLRYRIASCAQQESTATDKLIGDPVQWARDHRWEYALAPGWIGKVESALVAENPAWGRDPGVITDGDILAWTQPAIAEELSI